MGSPLQGKHRRLGPEPLNGSAFRAAVSDWQRSEEPFAGAGPMVRIPFPPAVSRQTIGSSAARQPAPEGELLTIKKAAVVLGVAPSTIHRLLNDGIIAGEQPTPGAPWRIRLTKD